MQVMLLNEFNKDTRFYSTWAIESEIREIAYSFANAYCIGIFACCREVKDEEEKHCGGFESREAASEAYKNKSNAPKSD